MIERCKREPLKRKYEIHIFEENILIYGLYDAPEKYRFKPFSRELFENPAFDLRKNVTTKALTASIRRPFSPKTFAGANYRQRRHAKACLQGVGNKTPRC